MHGDTREQMLELVALYALGVLPREEAALVIAFIATDDEARAEYEDLRAAADALALTADEPVDSARTARMKEHAGAPTPGRPAAGALCGGPRPPAAGSWVPACWPRRPWSSR